MWLRLGIFDKKIIPRKTEWTEKWFISEGIPVVPGNRKLPEFRSKFFRGREKTQNSVLWNTTRSKLSECCSEPFRGMHGMMVLALPCLLNNLEKSKNPGKRVVKKEEKILT
jgi:hypothetical protein